MGIKIYNFDRVIKRKGTDCKKWDMTREIFGSDDALPLWIADTDFAACPKILQALQDRIEHGIIGYPKRGASVDEAVCKWQKTRHGLDVLPEWVCHAPGVMVGAALALRAFTKPGDGVIVQPPIYPPFADVVLKNNRKLIWNPLINNTSAQRYEIDFEGLEKLLTSDAKALLLCSPHNPVARVWTAEELNTLAQMCAKKGVLVISDEIHQDVVYSDAPRHIPFLSVKAAQLDNCIMITSPSKTFNVPGLYTAVSIIPDKKLRTAYMTELDASILGRGNALGLIAMRTAYGECADWADELIKYLESSRNWLEAFLKEHIPAIKLYHPEGTFVFWLDFRELIKDGKELQNFLVNEAGLALNDGMTFGPGGEGFARINIGCPKAALAEAMTRLTDAAHRRGWV